MTQFNIRVKSYCRLTLLRTLIFNFERLDILRDSIRHPSKKDIVVLIGSEVQHIIWSVSIYYGTKSDIQVKSYFRLNLIRASVFNLEHPSINFDTLSGIRVKSYCRLNFLRVSIFNFERLDILRDSTGHPCIKLLSIHFSQSFGSKF